MRRTLTVVVELVLRVAAVEVPDDAADVVRARPIAARVVQVRAEELVEGVALEVADGGREEARADEQEEVGHDDHEDR